MRSVQSIVRLASRGLQTSSRRSVVSMKQSYSETNNRGIVPADSRYKKIQEMQNQMINDTENMVWQKRGAVDRAPFVLTVALCVVGLALGFSNLWTLSWPRKTD